MVTSRIEAVGAHRFGVTEGVMGQGVSKRWVSHVIVGRNVGGEGVDGSAVVDDQGPIRHVSG